MSYGIELSFCDLCFQQKRNEIKKKKKHFHTTDRNKEKICHGKKNELTKWE